MSNKEKENLLNCFLDLQRAAIARLVNPKGKTHKIFIAHAIDILAGVHNRKTQTFKRQLSRLLKQTDTQKDGEDKKSADKILTLGLLLKPTV